MEYHYQMFRKGKEKESGGSNQVLQPGVDVPGILEVLESLLTFDALCHAVGTDHVDPQIQHDCFRLSSLAGDNPIRNIDIHHCEFKID